ncbi:MAG: hypothetical protein ABI579_09875 [Candidatus Sumerlaeota bacterium]
MLWVAITATLSSCVEIALSPLEQRALKRPSEMDRDVRIGKFLTNETRTKFTAQGSSRAGLVYRSFFVDGKLITEETAGYTYRTRDNFNAIPLNVAELDVVYTFDPPVRTHWVALPKTVQYKLEKRSPLLFLTYPIYGLPQDLLDAPITALRRLGFADNNGGLDATRASTQICIFGSAAVGCVGAVALTVACVSFPWVIPAVVLAVPCGVVFGGIFGIDLSMGVFDLFNFAIAKPQNYLLRSGINSEDYFPNWKFAAHKPVITSQSEERVWVVTRIEEIHDRQFDNSMSD